MRTRLIRLQRVGIGKCEVLYGKVDAIEDGASTCRRRSGSSGTTGWARPRRRSPGHGGAPPRGHTRSSRAGTLEARGRGLWMWREGASGVLPACGVKECGMVWSYLRMPWFWRVVRCCAWLVMLSSWAWPRPMCTCSSFGSVSPLLDLKSSRTRFLMNAQRACVGICLPACKVCLNQCC